MANTDPTLNKPDRTSDSNAWLQWYKDLKDNFGRKLAVSAWTNWWGQQGGIALSHDTRDYLAKQGIEVDATGLAKITDVADDIFGEIGSFFQMGKIATIAVLAIVLGGVGMLVFNIAKSPIATIKAAK